MDLMVVIGIIGGAIAYCIARASGRPILVGASLGVVPSLGLLMLPPFIGLPLLLPWLPCVVLGTLAGGIHRSIRPPA